MKASEIAKLLDRKTTDSRVEILVCGIEFPGTDFTTLELLYNIKAKWHAPKDLPGLDSNQFDFAVLSNSCFGDALVESELWRLCKEGALIFSRHVEGVEAGLLGASLGLTRIRSSGMFDADYHYYHMYRLRKDRAKHFRR